MKIQFDNYVRMIRKWAWKYSKEYRIEYSDVESQGFLIYCNAIQNHKPEKASFSTHLHINLRGRLKDYCTAEKAKKAQDIAIDDFIQNIASIGKADKKPLALGFDIFAAREHGCPVDELSRYARMCLSADAYKVFNWALAEEYEKKPLLKDVQWFFFGTRGWKADRVKAAWVEMTELWRSGFLNRVLI